MSGQQNSTPGRPPATSHAAIESVAFALFAERGFDETTTDDIAEAAGIGRRTLFRYFPSKNDIPWGRFDDSLRGLHDALESMPPELPLWRSVAHGVVVFNTFEPAALPQHRSRMTLILRTPSLQAHSVLMYARWRSVIARFVARRTGSDPDALLPRTVGHVSLALAIAAYEEWLEREDASVESLLTTALEALRGYLVDDD